MNRIKSTFLAFVVAGLILGLSSIAQAQVTQVYVSALGWDSNSGARTAPVRTITRALSLVQASGEVIILDSGDYDQFSVNKAVTVEAAPGAVAIIPNLNYSTAIQVIPPTTAMVVLRGLTITAFAQSGPYGIQCLQGILHIENCVINGSFNYGIYADNCQLFVRDTTVRNNWNYGIFAVSSGASPTTASIVRCRLEKNYYGVFAYYNSRVTVRDTVATSNGNGGFYCSSYGSYTAELNVENCTSTHNWSGVVVDNTWGGGTAVVRVSNSTVTSNKYGFGVYGGGAYFYSRGNNTVAGNTTADTHGGLITLINGT